MIKQLFIISLILIVVHTNCSQSTEPTGEPGNIIVSRQNEPEFSADGEKVVFNGMYNDISAIHFVDREGNYLGHILENDSTTHNFFSSPSWGPGVNKIAVSINGNLYTVKEDGDSLTQLTFSWQDFSPSWSYDGQYIAYTKSICDPECGIAVYDLSKNIKRVIGEYGGHASWSKNSDKIYYYHTLYEKRPNSHISDYKGFVFRRIDINTLREDSLFYVKSTDDFHLWLEDCTISPDEKEILFAASEGAPPQIYIWKINLEQKSLYKMTVGNHPSFSPDGSTIVYTNTNINEGGIWIMNHNGSNKRRLTKLKR
jgi:Tol biopolymer transport system component